LTFGRRRGGRGCRTVFDSRKVQAMRRRRFVGALVLLVEQGVPTTLDKQIVIARSAATKRSSGLPRRASRTSQRQAS